MQQEIQEILQFCISIFWHQFFLNLCSKLLSVILLNHKKSNWFYFLHWCNLVSPKITAVFSRQNTELCGRYIFRSSCSELSYKEDVLKNFAKFGKHLCWSLFFNKVAGWKPPTLLKRDTGTGVVLWILQNLQEHLFCETPAKGYFQKCISHFYFGPSMFCSWTQTRNGWQCSFVKNFIYALVFQRKPCLCLMNRLNSLKCATFRCMQF